MLKDLELKARYNSDIDNPLKDLGEKAIEILFDTEKDKNKIIEFLGEPKITEGDSVHIVKTL